MPGTLLIHLATMSSRSRRCLVLCRNSSSARFLRQVEGSTEPGSLGQGSSPLI